MNENRLGNFLKPIVVDEMPCMLLILSQGRVVAILNRHDLTISPFNNYILCIKNVVNWIAALILQYIMLSFLLVNCN